MFFFNYDKENKIIIIRIWNDFLTINLINGNNYDRRYNKFNYIE